MVDSTIEKKFIQLTLTKKAYQGLNRLASEAKMPLTFFTTNLLLAAYSAKVNKSQDAEMLEAMANWSPTFSPSDEKATRSLEAALASSQGALRKAQKDLADSHTEARTQREIADGWKAKANEVRTELIEVRAKLARCERSKPALAAENDGEVKVLLSELAAAKRAQEALVLELEALKAKPAQMVISGEPLTDAVLMAFGAGVDTATIAEKSGLSEAFVVRLLDSMRANRAARKAS